MVAQRMEKNLLSCDFAPLEYGGWQSAVGKEVFVKPKRVARKRSRGVFAWVFLQIYVKVLQLSNLPDRTARNN